MFGIPEVVQRLPLPESVSAYLPKPILVWVNQPGVTTVEDARGAIQALKDATVLHDAVKNSSKNGSAVQVGGKIYGLHQTEQNYQQTLEYVSQYFAMTFSQGPAETRWTTGEVAGLFSLFSAAQVYAIFSAAVKMVENYQNEVRSHGGRV